MDRLVTDYEALYARLRGRPRLKGSGAAQLGVDVGQLRVDPALYAVVLDHLADPLQAICRSAAGMVSARKMASACSSMSKGFTLSA